MVDAGCPDNYLGVAIGVRVTKPVSNIRPVDTNDSERYTELMQVREAPDGNSNRIVEFDPVRGLVRITYIPDTTGRTPSVITSSKQERVFRAVEVVA